MGSHDGKGTTDRRKSLEEEFFARQNAKLKERLREKLDREESRGQLRAAYPNMPLEMIEHLLDHGFDAEAAAALWLVPLVLVAWADGSLSDREREAILKAADEHGIPAGSKAYERLDQWVRSNPSTRLEALWRGFVDSACHGIAEADRDRMRDGVLRLATEVAQAAGGFLGLGSRISAEEQKVLDRIAQAFQR